MVEGVHFLKDDPPETIAYKALAVNLSDLAAKGARPYAYLLALTLPNEPPARWLESSTSGLRALQEEAGIMLVGGDTTRTPGPLSLTMTVLGSAPQGTSVPRRGANASDRLYVTGTIGDSYLGLRLLQQPDLANAWALSKDDVAFLVRRYRKPEPRSALTTVVRNCAESAIDVSDGLVGDIEKLCHVSHVNAEIELDLVPLSAPGRKAVSKAEDILEAMIVAGDDYEIAAAVPASRSAKFEAEAAKAGVDVSAIGVIRVRGGGSDRFGPRRSIHCACSQGFLAFLSPKTGPMRQMFHSLANQLRTSPNFRIFRAKSRLGAGPRYGSKSPAHTIHFRSFSTERTGSYPS